MSSSQEPFVAFRTPRPPRLDGTLSDPVWQAAPKTPPFVDMATGEPALLETRASVLWDDECLYVGFWIEEPYPTAKLTERDSLIFQENDVEVFIDGGDCYYEFEINALGTVYEVFFIWKDAYVRGSRFDVPEFDLLDRKALTFGGNFDRTEEHFWTGTHPRGVRWAFLDWDFPGMRSAVHVDGGPLRPSSSANVEGGPPCPPNAEPPARTEPRPPPSSCVTGGELNHLSVRSKGWSVELAFPWSGMGHLGGSRAIPPKDGDIWKLFLGRFQKINVGDAEVQAAWCCTPHGVYDTHMPERFTKVRFSSENVEE